MARDLTIKVTADTTAAVANLNKVEGALGEVQTAAKPAALATDQLQKSNEDLTAWLAKTDAAIAADVEAKVAQTAVTEGVTVATQGFGASLVATAEGFAAAISAIAPYLVAVAAVTEALVWLTQKYEDYRLKTETEAAKQDTINAAIARGASATIDYAHAIEFLTDAEARRRSQIPEEQAQRFLDNLTKTTRAGIDAAASALALEEGLAKLGIVQGMTAEDTKRMNEEWEKQQHAAEKVRESHEKLVAHIQARELNVLGDLRLHLHDVQVDFEKWDTQTQKMLAHLAEMEHHLIAIQAPLNTFAAGLAALPANIEEVTNALRDMVNTEDYGPSLHQLTLDVTDEFDEIKKAAARTIGAINQLFIAAFTGGGGVAGAIKGLATTAIEAFSFLLGPIGKFVGQFAGAIVAGVSALFGGGPSEAELAGRRTEATFEKSFGGFQKMLEKITDAYKATGRTAEEARKDVLRLIEAEKEGAEAVTSAIDKINKAFDDIKEQKQSWDDVKAAAEKYGLTLEELGPTFRKQLLDETAAQLLKDWKLLTGAGADVAAVTKRMSKNILDYVHDAMRTGTEVPLALKPLIEQLAKMGLLTDLDGKKIDDVRNSGIIFGETLTNAFKGVEEAINRMVRALETFLGLTDKLPERIGLQPPVPGQPPTTGPGRGGVVTPRTGGVTGLGSSFVPVGGGSVQVTVYVDGDVNSPAARDKLARTVLDVLDNDRNLRRKVSAR